MTFSATGLSLVRRLRGNLSEWNYTSGSDDPTVIAGGGYFNGAADRFRVGDLVLASANGTPQVFAVSGNTGSAVTITALPSGGGGGAGTVNNDDWLGTDLAIVNGGTGASDAATARTNLGLAALATKATINDADWSGTDLSLANGGTGASDAATARTNLGLGTLATAATVNDANWSGADLAIANGGTGSSTAADARTALGLGTLATETTIDNADWDAAGADLSLANGGTGASDATAARTNLGLGTLATAATVNNDVWSGTDLTIANGGTGASDAATARINLGIAAGSEAAAGILELATAGETNTGTDNTRAVSPDALAGSYAGTAAISLALTNLPTDSMTTGDGKSGFLVAGALNGMNLVSALVVVATAGTTGLTTLQVRRRRAGANADMLSTPLTIDSAETSSATAAAAAVINAANDDLATGDLIYVDVDGVSTTPPQGGIVALEARLP